MKGRAAKVVLAAVVCVVLLVGLAGLTFVKFVESDAFQDRLREGSEAMLGVPIGWQRAKARWLPPALVLRHPALELRSDDEGRKDDEDDDRSPGLHWTAEAGEIRPALRALLAGEVEVEAVAFTDGRVEIRDRLRSTRLDVRLDGVHMQAKWGVEREAAAIRVSGRLGSGTRFVARGTLTSTTAGETQLRFEDLAFRSTDLANREIVGRGTLFATGSPATGLRLEADLDLGDAGGIAFDVARQGRGNFDVRVRPRAFDLTLLRPAFADLEFDVAGRATGTVRVVGIAEGSDVANAELRIESARWRMPDYLVEGSLPVVVEIENPFTEQPNGRFELDLTATHLDYQGRLQKPSGMAAHLTTRFALDSMGQIVSESRVSLSGLDQIFRPAGRNGRGASPGP